MSQIDELQEVFAETFPNSVTFSATRSMLERSNRTAFAEFRDVARASGLHDFESQKPGVKRYLRIDFLYRDHNSSELEWVRRKLTLNITPSTKEHRFWVEKLNQLVDRDDVLVIGFDATVGTVGVNLSAIRSTSELRSKIESKLGTVGTETGVATADEEPWGSLYETLGSDSSQSDKHAHYVVISRRIIRDTVLTKRVKEFHDFRCQVCDEQLVQANGSPYAEGAHILPLSQGGPDVAENMLCLCPNHHVMLDSGSIFIDDRGAVWNVIEDRQIGKLRCSDRHEIDHSFFKSQRELFSTDQAQSED